MIKFTLIGEQLPLDVFEATKINNTVSTKVTHEFTGEHLDEVLPAIRDFLKGLGYEPVGDLEFVDNFSTEEPFVYKADSWLNHNTKGNSE